MKLKNSEIKDLIVQASRKLPKHEVKEIGDRVWRRLKAEMEKRKDELALRSLSGDGWNHAPELGEADFQVLSAVKMLGGRGSLVDVMNTIERWTGQVLLAQSRLRTLAERGLVAGESRYQVTELGERALGRAKLEDKVFERAVVETEAREREHVGDALPGGAE